MGRACGTGSGQRINRLFFSGVQQNVIRIYQAVYGGCMAKLNRAFVYRLYPDAEQAGLIQKTFGCCRFVYNYFLNARIKAYTEENRSVSFSQQSAALPALKKEFPWLAEVDSTALVASAKALDTAYQRFFDRVKSGGPPGFPRFKSKYHSRKSYKTTNPNGKTIEIRGNKIKFLKIGWVNAAVDREIPADYRILGATIRQDPSGKYYASVSTEHEQIIPEIHPDPATAVGLDYSSPHFYVDSDGNEADMPHYYRNMEDKLAREQRKLSKMEKGSSNYRKQRIKVARVSEKIRNRRKDWQHKESTRLADAHDIICVEDINYQDMSRGLHLAKATNDNAFGQFREFLSYKMAERGKRLIKVDKWYPSSKTCRHCGSANRELTLKDRRWICPNCGAEIERDINAAINIRDQGLADLEKSQ